MIIMGFMANVDKALTLYRSMSLAIDHCFRVDQCADIIDKSVGIGAYYKQIKDEETERKFIVIRLRAWRRIAELFSGALKGLKEEKLKTRGPEKRGVTNARRIECIRTTFDERATKDMSDLRIIELIRLSEISKEDFETTMARPSLTGALGNFFDNTPEILAQRERNRKAAAERERLPIKKDSEPIVETPPGDVGITLERHDRKEMRTFEFILSEELHAAMRQGAFDHKITMHEVLRQGLRMWLTANDYEIEE